MTSDQELGFDLINPVVGVELNPPSGASPDSSQFKWYRQLYKKKVNCSVHEFRKAILQCKACVRLSLPIQDSYLCSTDCYKKYHCVRHYEELPELKNAFNIDEISYVLSVCPLIKRNEIRIDQNGTSWLHVGSSRTYIPSADDLGCILRLEIVTSDGSIGRPIVLISSPVAPHVPLGPRQMIQIEYPYPHQKALPFRLVSYNILADLYGTSKKYTRTWEYRRQNLLREIAGYQADIICLQEVQTDHFVDFFKPEFERRGYSIVYATKEKSEVYTKDGFKTDGCATFFRANKFKKVEEHQFLFVEVAEKQLDELQDLQPSQRETGRRRLKDNVAIITILEAMDGTASDTLHSRFCVVNTHIYSNEEFKDVKLWQVASLMEELQKKVDISIPILLCGDLNSCPGSAPYDLIVHGKVDTRHNEFPEDPVGIFNHIKLSHRLPLVSAYSLLPGDGLQCTNFSNGFSGTLDYIFYSKYSFKVRKLLNLLDSNYIANTCKTLPSPEWSSDHIALVADLCLCED